LSLLLPSLLHGQCSEHDCLRASHAAGSDGRAIVSGGRIEESTDHVDTTVLDFGGLGILFVVDEILGEGLGHELLSLLLHVGGDEGSEIQHGVAVEGEVVLDHAVGDISRHFLLGHLMLGQVLSSKPAAVDGGGELVGVVVEADILELLGEGVVTLVDLLVVGDGS